MLNVDRGAAPVNGPHAKQTATSSETRLLPALLIIAKSVRALYGLKLGALGFTNGQDEILLAVDGEGTFVSVLAARLMIRASSASKMLDRLADRGLVEKTDDKLDGRRAVVRITPAGVEARDLLIEMREVVESELSKALNSQVGVGMAPSLALCAAQLTKQLMRHR